VPGPVRGHLSGAGDPAQLIRRVSGLPPDRTAVAGLGLAVMLASCPGKAGKESAVPDAAVSIMTVKGTLTYRARIALPPNGIAVVEIRDLTRTDSPIVAELRRDLMGRQVPIPFELSVERARLEPGRAYRLRGAILSGGRPIWVSDPVAIDPAKAAVDIGAVNLAPFKVQAFARTLRCGDKTITAGFDGDLLRLTAGVESFDMRRVETASGARYVAVNDSMTTLWTKGRTATLQLRGQVYPECTEVTPEQE